jgi:hypothetical protein
MEDNVRVKIEKLMPDLLTEMRKDLADYPTAREVIILNRSVVYNGDGSIILMYYYEDHSDLNGKITVLVNYGLLREITYNNVKRYTMSEGFADYLTGE